MPDRKVLVVGPEASGTWYVTRVLSSAGVDVTHKSIPDGKDWIEPAWMLKNFDLIVWMTRHPVATIQGQVRTGHSASTAQAELKLRSAWKTLGELLTRDLEDKVVMVPYGGLRDEGAIEALLKWLGVSPPESYEAFTDGNEKYWSHK